MDDTNAGLRGDDGPFRESAVVRVRGSGERAAVTAPARRPSVPVAHVSRYTKADWEAESFALFAEGADPAACPECGKTGFFGPRVVNEVIKCRACRFCGFWQQIDHAPLHQLPTVHGCSQWPEVSKALYVWWVLPDVESYTCPFCSGTVKVPLSLVGMPVDELEHPWRRIPQRRSQSFYQRLWGNWPVTAGRVVL